MFLPLLFHRNPTFELSLFLRAHLERLPISRKIDNRVVNHIEPILRHKTSYKFLILCAIDVKMMQNSLRKSLKQRI